MKETSYFRLTGIVAVVIVLTFMTGCLYPEEQRKSNQASTGEYILLVQQAVDQYHKKTGVLPIRNSEVDTPLYEKYIIQFPRLVDNGLLSTIPADAFEKGGSCYYVLVDVETKPTVKLLNIAVMQQAAAVQADVNQYISKNGGNPPLGEKISDSFYRLDFDKMRKSVQQVKSDYSDLYLSYLVHESGRIAIDYAPEIAKVLDKKGVDSPDAATDLRKYLVEESHYVPPLSYPYYWKNGEPSISE